MLLVCLLFVFANIAKKEGHAQEPSATTSEPVHRVFIPVDEQGERTGDYYYVPGSLYQEFLRIQQLEGSSENRWSLVSALYQGSVSTHSNTLVNPPLPGTAGVFFANFKVTFEVDLETEQAVIALPPLPLLSDSATWDGQPIQSRVFRSAEENERNRVSTGDWTTEPENMPKEGNTGYLLFSVKRQRVGRHKLELLLHPGITQVNETRRRLSFAIPSIPDAMLELNLSPDAPSITVENAYGIINNEPGKITAQLGPINQLTLSWIDETPKSGQAVVETEQLFWLRARPNQMDIAALYKFRVSGGKVRSLDIAADPRMQFIGSPLCTNPDIRIERVEQVPNTEGVYRLYFTEPVSGPVSIQANYLYQRNFSGIGVVRFPQIPMLGRTVQSIMAIALDPTLESPNLPPSTFPIDRFRLDWGPTEDIPAAVYDLTKLDPGWMLEIRTRKTEISGRVRQSVIVRLGQANTQLDVALQSNRGVFEHVLLVPEEYTITSIELKDAQSTIPVHWIPRSHSLVVHQPQTSSQTSSQTSLQTSDQATSSQIGIDETGVSLTGTPSDWLERRYKEVTIFSGRPVNGNYHLTVYGRSTFPSSELQTIPLLVLRGIHTKSDQLDLYRDSLVLIDNVYTPPKWTKCSLIEAAPTSWSQAVPVGSWMIREEQEEPAQRNVQGNTQANSVEQEISETAIWTVRPNHPVISGRQVTQLVYNRNIDRWDLVVDLNLIIKGGELNGLRFHYDELCGPSPNITPPIRWEILPGKENMGRTLVLTPIRPLSGSVQLTIKTPINTTLDTITLPRLVLETEPVLPHFLVLPNDLNLKPIDWEVKQLSRVNLSDIPDLSLIRQPGQTDSVGETPGTAEPNSLVGLSAYSVNGPEYEVSIRPSGRQPIVQLNDVSLLLKRNGTLSGVSSFDLRGDGADSCVLVMPDELELLQLKSGGITSRGREIATGRWKVDLWPNNLPQKVEVVFRGELAHSRNQRRVLRSVDPTSANTTQENTQDATIPLFTSLDPQSLVLPLPHLESLQVAGTIWTLTFEKSDRDEPVRYSAQSLDVLPEQGSSPTLQVMNPSEWLNLEKTALLPLSYREAIPIFARIDLLRLSSMSTMLENAVSALPTQRSDITSWYSHWGENWWSLKKELDSLLVFQKNEGQTLWSQSVFRSNEQMSGAFATMLDSLQNVNQNSQVLLEEYTRLMNRIGLESQNREIQESEIPQTGVFSVFRMNQPDNVVYLFGVSEGAVGAIEVFSLPKVHRIWENPIVRWTGWIILIVVGFWGIRRLHLRRLFRQFPFFVSTVVAILLWLILTPGFLGLLLLPFIWLAMIWPSWRPRRRSS